MVQGQGTVGQSDQYFDMIENRRFTTYALSKKDNVTNARIIGYFKLKRSVHMHPHVIGTIHFEGTTYPVLDRHVLSGRVPKDITDESCIVFLTADESLRSFDTAVIVDDITELLSLADEVPRK